MSNDNENETTDASAPHKTRATIERLLRAAEWSIVTFEKVREEMSGPLAILTAGNRCMDMALKIQQFEHNERGADDFTGSIDIRWAPSETHEGESDGERN
jgi:hypothetical protein